MTNVLLIDDEEDMGSLVQACLDQFGATVHQVHSVSEAIAGPFGEHLNLILLDFKLKDEDGFNQLPRLRETPALQGVPIIGFTVHESMRAEALSGGMDGFVPKPFSVPQLRAAVEPFLR